MSNLGLRFKVQDFKGFRRSLMQQSHVANLLMASVGSKEEQQQQHRRRKKISRDLRRVLPPLPALVSN
ncbi:unnamed protein product [Sphagnum troendelagicum]|uniref:Uncharacterized protein n=1 Tax=Sphagnum troendelagicum TaxID=128251 RepID=A0ABP0UIX8_9BRYO